MMSNRRQPLVELQKAPSAALLKPPTTKPLWGEVIAYDSSYNALRQPLYWIQMIELLWFSAFFIVFTILSIGERAWFNNWVALLVYFIVTAGLVVVAQIVAVMIYFNNNRRELKYSITPSNSAYNIQAAYAYANYMGMAHTKEILLAIAVTISSSIVAAFLWYDWLGEYKGAGSFVGDAALTSVNMSFDTPEHILEYNTYQTLLYLLALLQLIPILYLIRAIWAHLVPLRSIAHLSS
jgi:hypothetical protein